MPKNVLRGISIILGMLFLYGCAATENVEVRRYVEVKDRLDQNMEGGNAGYLFGTPQPEDRSGIRKTRKTYVIEVSKSVAEEAEEVIVEGDDAVVERDDAVKEESAYDEEDMGFDYDESTPTWDAAVPSRRSVSVEETVGEAVKSSSSIVEYTVQKDDTLQKISKKFYDSYSKWPKIYELNKDVISDPNKIKPGIVLKIPTL